VTPDGARHVFIGGLHRSGTTPLARVIGAHPEVSGLTGTGASEDEGQHLQDVYPRIRRYGGMGRFANAPAAHLTADSPLATPANAVRLLAAWSPYWDGTKPYLLEKSPANLIMGGFLQALFPGSALIVVIRHPLAVALAMQKWNPPLFARNGRRRTTLAGLVGHWVRAHEILAADAASLARLHVLRYEDLVADPVERLGDVQRFLGLDSPLDADSVRAGRSERYQQQWDGMAVGNPIARAVRRRIEERFGAAITAYGYDLDDLSSAPGVLAVPNLQTR
jgi:sulfotransferase family protein